MLASPPQRRSSDAETQNRALRCHRHVPLFPNWVVRHVRNPDLKTAPFLKRPVLQFLVSPKMNKLEIAEYLRKLYGMPVTKVHTANYDGKEKRDPRDPTKRQTHQPRPPVHQPRQASFSAGKRRRPVGERPHRSAVAQEENRRVQESVCLPRRCARPRLSASLFPHACAAPHARVSGSASARPCRAHTQRLSLPWLPATLKLPPSDSLPSPPAPPDEQGAQRPRYHEVEAQLTPEALASWPAKPGLSARELREQAERAGREG